MSARIEGWKAIAAVLGVSESTARAYASRGVSRVRREVAPVFIDYRRRPFASLDDLLGWLERNPRPKPGGLIYGFFDRDGVCRYVGQTRQTLEDRVAQHVESASDPKTAFSWWLAWFWDEHRRLPRVDALEEVEPTGDLDERERAWIQRHAGTVFNFARMPRRAAS